MLIQAITLEINVVILIVLVCLFFYVKGTLDDVKNTGKKENSHNKIIGKNKKANHDDL